MLFIRVLLSICIRMLDINQLKECYKIMRDNSIMFLSCPNNPGNGYDIQYAAHIYEWGYDEIKEALDEIGFETIQEVGLVMGAKEMDEFYATQPT